MGRGAREAEASAQNIRRGIEKEKRLAITAEKKVQQLHAQIKRLAEEEDPSAKVLREDAAKEEAEPIEF